MEEYINKLKDYPPFLEFEKYIIGVIDELRDDESYEKLDDLRAGQEAKTNIKVRRKLLEILLPFINFQEKKEPTEEQIKQAKAKYNL